MPGREVVMSAREIVAIMLAATLMLFILCSAYITVTHTGLDEKAMGFWTNFLSTVVGGLVGYIAGNNKDNAQ